MKRWLVTGGVGFIGHHLTRTLLARGDSVRVVDDFSNDQCISVTLNARADRPSVM